MCRFLGATVIWEIPEQQLPFYNSIYKNRMKEGSSNVIVEFAVYCTMFFLFLFLHFSPSHVNGTPPIQSLRCPIRGLCVYFLTIWMTSSCSMMCVRPTLCGLHLVLVPWKRTVNRRSTSKAWFILLRLRHYADPSSLHTSASGCRRRNASHRQGCQIGPFFPPNLATLAEARCR